VESGANTKGDSGGRKAGDDILALNSNGTQDSKASSSASEKEYPSGTDQQGKSSDHASVDLDEAIALSLQAAEDEYEAMWITGHSTDSGTGRPSVDNFAGMGALTSDTDTDRALALSLMMEERSMATTTLPAKNANEEDTKTLLEFADLAHNAAAEEVEPMKRSSEKRGQSCDLQPEDLDEMIAIAQSNEENERAMDSSFQGRAWRFIDSALEAHGEIFQSMTTTTEVEPVAIDDMLCMVERMLEAQATFRLENKGTHVDIGYHYTRKENLERIKTNGLLSRMERNAKGVSACRYNGSAWGDGVYTANDPYSHSSYGDIGLLVARLKGDSNEAVPGGQGFVGDTAIAHRGQRSEMVILGQSYQCVPLFKFQRSDITTRVREGQGCLAEGNQVVWDYHCRLQKIVDKFFNDSMPTTVQVVPPPPSAPPPSAPFGIPVQRRRWVANPGRHPAAPPWHLGPSQNGSPDRSETYRYASSSDHGGKGWMPSGTMRVSRYRAGALDFHGVGGNGRRVITVVYSIPSGVCLDGEVQIGPRCISTGSARCTSAHMVAFLPGDIGGMELSVRMTYAFCHGLTFVAVDANGIPVSAKPAGADGASHPSVALARSLVPHKTNPYGAFPDPSYVAHCNKVLDDLIVPPWNECDLSVSLVLLKTGMGAIPVDPALITSKDTRPKTPQVAQARHTEAVSNSCCDDERKWPKGNDCKPDAKEQKKGVTSLTDCPSAPSATSGAPNIQTSPAQRDDGTIGKSLRDDEKMSSHSDRDGTSGSNRCDAKDRTDKVGATGDCPPAAPMKKRPSTSHGGTPVVIGKWRRRDESDTRPQPAEEERYRH